MGRARKSRVDSKVKIQLDKWEDHRPFFTWWVSTVQVLVLIFALVDNGFADFGLDIKPYRRTVQERYVHRPPRTVRPWSPGNYPIFRFTEKTLDLEEETNFYFGPSNQVLIRLGAKYTPCMRRDKQIYDIIDCERNLEKDTACCVNAAVRKTHFRLYFRLYFRFMIFFRIDVPKRMLPRVALIFTKLDILMIWSNLLIEKNFILGELVELFVALILFIVMILIHSGQRENLYLIVRLTNGWMI